MNKKQRIGIMLIHSEIFNQWGSKNSFSLLEKYNSKVLLELIAHINAILFLDARNSDIRILEEVFQFRNTFSTSLLTKLEKVFLQNYEVFSSASISRLLKSILNNHRNQDDLTYTFRDLANDLFETILLFNEEYFNYDKEIETKSYPGLIHIDALQQNFIRTTPINVYMFRTALMCKFLSQDSLLRNYTKEYCNLNGIADPWKICKFLLNLYKQNIEIGTIFKIYNDDVPNRLLESWTINYDDDLLISGKVSINFSIIPKPFYRINPSELVILDLKFLQFIVDQGFFFNIFHDVMVGRNSKFETYNSFKSYIGLKFFEKYLCSKVIHRIFSHRTQMVLSNEKYQDFIVKPTSKDLIIFEAKMNDLHATTIEELDYAKFKKGIDENFLSVSSKTKKNKGVFQIFRQIDQLLDPKNQSEILCDLGVKKVKTLNIYPVLLVSDTNYNILGTNKYINEEIEQKIRDYEGRFQSVKPVLVLNINTLIYYYSYFKNDRNAFTDTIKSYFEYVKSENRKYCKFGDGLGYLNSSFSFNAYIYKKIGNKSNTFIKGDDLLPDFNEELDTIDFHN